jgi:tetratricopeptide (TPR) repeat protein
LEGLQRLETQFAGNPNLLAYVYGYSALAFANAGEAKQAEEVARKLLNPATSCTSYWQNVLARFLATAEVTAQRNPALAVELAERAVQFNPKSYAYCNTLAVARYRTGAWRRAVAELKQSASLANGGKSYDWFFLAMAHWQLDEKAEARRCYDQGVLWMEKNAQDKADLRRFRVEAEELIKEGTGDRQQEIDKKR